VYAFANEETSSSHQQLTLFIFQSAKLKDHKHFSNKRRAVWSNVGTFLATISNFSPHKSEKAKFYTPAFQQSNKKPRYARCSLAHSKSHNKPLLGSFSLSLLMLNRQRRDDTIRVSQFTMLTSFRCVLP